MSEQEAADGPHGGTWAGEKAYWRPWRIVGLALLINTAIAVFLWAVVGWSLRSTLVHSHAIGLSILAFQYAGYRWFPAGAGDGAGEPRDWVIAVVTVPLGVVVGVVIGAATEGTSPLRLFTSAYPGRAVLLVAAVFGLVVTGYLHGRARLAAGEARLREEQLRRASAGRAVAEAELKLLQAQIEPHFLFNTLSHVLQLVDADPARAKRMLMNLTSYLRGSLRRTRAGHTTLGEELDLVRAHLEIQAVRMGERLAWTLRCPDELREVPLPPLLLQPLVENALRHGLEPKPGGGHIAVAAQLEGETLVLDVQDDGLGLDPRRPPGVGLTNVRERVRALSRGAGSVTLRPVQPSGLCVRISLPRDLSFVAEPPGPAGAPEGSP